MPRRAALRYGGEVTPRRALALTAAAAALGLGLGRAPTARADASAQRVVVDQAIVEPALVPGLARLRVHATAIDINGAIIDVDGDKRWTVQVGGSTRRDAVLVGQADAAAEPLALVLVIENAAEYAEDLEVLTAAVAEHLLADLPPSTMVGVQPYGDVLGPATRLGPAKAASAPVTALTAEAEPGAPALLDAVDRALTMLRKAKTSPPGLPLRKAIIVLSDGRDRDDDRARTTQLGQRAARDGVRIHTLGFSPSDTRRPLLSLGELSRQSLGTFRWIRSRGEQAVRDQVVRLRSELRDQYVLTLLAPASELASKKVVVKLTLADRELVSNEVKASPARCSTEPGADACATGYCVVGKCVERARGERGGALGLVLKIAGIAGAGVVVLGVLGWWMSRRTRVVAPAAAASMALPAQPATGAHLAAASGHLPRAASAPAVAGAQLYVLTGALAGTRVGLRHGFVLGALPACDLVADPSASPYHAQIVADDRFGWRVIDLGSTSGTFVNGVRIADQRLQHGVTIRVGSTEVRFLAQ